MKAMRLHKVGEFTLDEVNKPIPKGNEILVKVNACGICGSDIPRVYELGTRVYPVTLGHEFAGTICDVGNNEDKNLIGKIAAIFPIIPCKECLNCQTGNYAQCVNYQYLGSRNDGGFSEYCLVPSKWHLIFSDNSKVDVEDLSLVEPATVAQHAMRKSKLSAGENVVIIGAGPIGILVARWAKIFGANNVVLMEIDDWKINFARNLGLTVYDVKQNNCIETVKKDLEDIHVVIEGTGTSSGINNAVYLVRAFGRIVMMGNPHRDTTLALQNHSLILRKEIELVGMWNSYYVDYPFNEWKFTVKAIDDGILKVNDLITYRSSLDNLKDTFDKIYYREINICKAIYSDKC